MGKTVRWPPPSSTARLRETLQEYRKDNPGEGGAVNARTDALARETASTRGCMLTEQSSDWCSSMNDGGMAARASGALKAAAPALDTLKTSKENEKKKKITYLIN